MSMYAHQTLMAVAETKYIIIVLTPPFMTQRVKLSSRSYTSTVIAINTLLYYCSFADGVNPRHLSDTILPGCPFTSLDVRLKRWLQILLQHNE